MSGRNEGAGTVDADRNFISLFSPFAPPLSLPLSVADFVDFSMALVCGLLGDGSREGLGECVGERIMVGGFVSLIFGIKDLSSMMGGRSSHED